MPDSGESALSRAFRAVVAAADGRTEPDWLAQAVADPTVRERLADLASVLGDEEPLGTAYQTHLSDDQQTASGHFATEPAVATALCRWAIQPRDDRVPRVLDPATGSGVFTLAAHDRLATIAPDHAPTARLQRVVGVDTDPVALALTAHRLLAAVDSDPATLHLYETDFFDCEPGSGESCTVTADGVTIGQFDAVVGNPPYIRQETVETERLRQHLTVFGPDGETPYADGDRALSRRSDAYVYFVTHATQFLRPGGRLAVVIPAKWLTARYGRSFQQFLFDHYRVTAIVGFGARVFDDALVDTVLLLAQRCDREETRRSTPVRFCRLDEQVRVETLISTIERADPLDGESMRIEDDAIRTVTVRQGILAETPTSKQTPYLDAPEPFLRLLAGETLTRLGAFTTVSRGVMTGANEFFFVDSDAPDIDDRFLAPAIKSIRDVTKPVVTTGETDRYLLDVHDYVTTLRAETTEAVDSETVVAALARDGYDGLRAYIEWGESQGFHERRTCAKRSVWFDLGTMTAPAVFVPKFFDRRVLAIANPDELVASNAVDCVWIDDGVDARVLLGVLNSTLTKAMLECWGRTEGGGALQLMTYELSTLPVPDPRTFPPETRQAIASATDGLLAGEDVTRRLDRLVLDALGIDLSVDRCRALREEMVRGRVRTGQQVSAPLVDD